MRDRSLQFNDPFKSKLHQNMPWVQFFPGENVPNKSDTPTGTMSMPSLKKK